MSSFKLLPLMGLASMRAMNAYHTLVIGLKMQPMFLHMDYPQFLEHLESLPAEEQESMLRQSLALVPLETDELMALVRFAVDGNGIPFTKVNVDNLRPQEVFDICIAVAIAVSKEVNVDLVSKAEQKKNRELLDRPEGGLRESPAADLA